MHEITMPKAGQSMEDGTIVRWVKTVGQTVAAGDILLEVETDKATVEVESDAAGTLLKILVPEGETVPVHTPIALLGQAGENVSAAAASSSPQSTQGAQREEKAEAPTAAAPATPEPSAAGGPVTPVLMPKAGQSMEEGTIVSWKVKPGDRVNQGDILFEVETDKANVEVESDAPGRIARIVVPEGETVEVLVPVAFLAESDADVDAYLASQGGSEPLKKEDAASVATGSAASSAMGAPEAVAATAAKQDATGRVKASPAARKIAGEKGVDLAAVGSGRGPDGRILSDDVLEAAKRGVASAPAATSAATLAPAPATTPAAPGEVVRRKLTGMRKAIARNLVQSKTTVPHFYMRMTFDAAPMQDYYRGEKAKYPCSLNDVVVLAVGRTLAEFPAFRSRIEGEEIAEYPTANIGLAVGLENGLVVPVVMGADAMSLKQLASESRRIIESARRGKIENMGQGVFTISNLGMFGVEEFSAIINPPESGILAVGTIREEVIVSGGTMRPGKVMTVTLSADHRVADGLVAAKFLARLKELLEFPAALA